MLSHAKDLDNLSFCI